MGSKPKPATQSGTSNQTTDMTGWQEAISNMVNNSQGQSASTWNPTLNPYVDRMLQTATRSLELSPGYAGLDSPQFQGQLYAGPTANQQAGIQSMVQAAGQLGQGNEAVRQLGLDTISGKYLSPDSNPFIKGAYEAAVRPITQQLQRQIIPGISDAAQGSGAYGGARQGIMEGTAAADWAKASGDIGANMYFNNYNNERNRQMQAPTLLSAADAMALAPSQALLAAGTAEQGWQQGQLNANRQEYINKANDLWGPLQNYQNIIGSLLGFGTTNTQGTNTSAGTNTVNSTQHGTQAGTQTGTYTAPGQSGFGGALSGALGGASAGGMFGPWGAGIGAVLGGLGGLFG